MPSRTPAALSGELRLRYRGLKRLLGANSEMLELMADLEADLHELHPGERQVREPIMRLMEGSLLLAENLNAMTRNRHLGLYEAHRRIEGEVRDYMRSLPAPEALPLRVSLEEAGRSRSREVGGKAANLGELKRFLPDLVPPGFVITTGAFRLFLEENELASPLRKLVRGLRLDTGREVFRERLAAARALIMAGHPPARVSRAIAEGAASISWPGPFTWAVRSSAVGEDGRLSFAGQFDSVLKVDPAGLETAYKRVLASRYTDRAALYRLIGGFADSDTPMAALFLPMIEARSAGVLYSRDPRDETAERMLINSVWGLAEALVRGRSAADTFVASRQRPGEIEEQRLAAPPLLLDEASVPDRPPPATDAPTGPSLTPPEIKALVETALQVEKFFGSSQDLEWVFDQEGRLMLVQARRLRIEERKGRVRPRDREPALIEGGVTVFPGRAVGPAHLAASHGEIAGAPEGSILVVRQATPEIVAALPVLAGLVAEQGNPTGHAGALIREFGVPSLFEVKDALARVREGQELSLDATNRRLFEGALWPEVRDRVKVRIGKAREVRPASPLHQLILSLNLTDPTSMSFRADKCRSVHDLVRFTHEKAVAAMFELGDQAAGRARHALAELDSAALPGFSVLDLGGAIGTGGGKKARAVKPEHIDSAPFQALWRGVTAPGVSWTGRKLANPGGFMSVLGASMADRSASIRGLGERNYIIVAPEYVNLNARLAYHFAMVDALVSDTPENNYLNFRFRGGGAGQGRRDLRARLITTVLLESSFSVDRRGDLVTAWVHRRPRADTEDALTLLGKLMGCARQLDMLLHTPADVDRYVTAFLQGDYQSFA